MPRRSLIASLLVALAAPAHADDLLFSYDADVLPYTPAGGFALFDPCDFQCVETILPNGKLKIEWGHHGGDIVNYDRDIAPIEETPATLWVEWRFRSNIVRPFNDVACDGHVNVQYGEIVDSPNLYGNAVASFFESVVFAGLPFDSYYTLRFESSDGLTYSFAVDGVKWFQDIEQTNLRPPSIQFGGHGECTRPPGAIQRNEWDFVRYGTLADGEAATSTDPATGVLDADGYPNLDRFIVIFDQPAFVYVDDIAVASTGGPVPQVQWVKRLDNGPPDTVEIVLDRPLPLNATTTFTLDTGGEPQVVAYTYELVRACCLPGGLCSLMNEPDCETAGGEFNPNDADDCEDDLDGDGVDAICGDQCPMDEDKIAPGVCGCGAAALDSDGDTVVDCLDQCPGEDDRIDADENGTPDCAQFQPIPTASTWGIATLALLLLIAAKLRSSVFPSRDRKGVVAKTSLLRPRPSSPLT